MSADFQILLEQFYKINGKINKMRSTPIRFEGTEPLNTAAIHLIDVIGKHPEYNVTQIAQTLGNTKGAVSQMTAKLERKGLLEKRQAAASDKEIQFVLTDEGRKVYDGHERLHAELYQRLECLFRDFTPEDVEKLKKAGDAIDECLTEYGHL